jgi:hypothetical protein
MSLGQAKSTLWERGFNVGEIGRDDDINLVNQKDASVYRQSPAPNRVAAPGTQVSIGLSLDETKIAEGSAAADREGRRAIQEQEAARAAAADTLNRQR